MRVWIFDDNIDTDAIMPAKYLNNNDPAYFSQYCLEIVSPKFAKEAKPGDFILAGENFGCGSSRESAPYAIKYLGINGIIAKSFSRIFYRNAINIGLPVIIADQNLYDRIAEADSVSISDDYSSLKYTHGEKRTAVDLNYPSYIKLILESDGLINAYERGLV